ncbi:MAG TPA: hypothetical protein VGN52_04405 [Burkholderiales bacterium]|jgi:hypothetical protein
MTPEPRSPARDAPLTRTPAQDAALAQRYFWAAAIVLVAGLAMAGYVYWSAVDDGTDAVLAQMSRGKDYDYQLQRMGGQAMVLMAEFNDWFSNLWHGTNLACMLGGGSLLTALVCFWIGRRLSALSRGAEAPAPGGE